MKWSLLLLLLFSSVARALPPLQLYIALTPSGGTLALEPGRYAGPAVIDKPMTLDGGGAATIDGGGRGTVLTVKADGVTVRGVHLTNSGDSHDSVDAGLLVEAHDGVFEENTIDHTLFGIHLRRADGNVVRANRITSRPKPELNLRGDGIRMWYSHENRVEENELTAVRDVVVINAPENRLINNTIVESGVGMQFVFSHNCEATGNRVLGNTTGFVVLYSDEVVLRGNRLEHIRGQSGMGVAVKDSSLVLVERNKILHCAVGMEMNAPTHPENTMTLRDNLFAYNDIAMYFYGEKGGHAIYGNRFEHNHLPIAVSAYMSARANQWAGNYWDEYEGFDLDGDGVGDTPHDIYLYSDRIWLDRPMARFFRGSPVMEVIDFIERLAPFSSPERVLRDPAPLMRPPDAPQGVTDGRAG